MESRSRRLAAQAEVTISRMERQLATHKAIVGETTTMEVTMIDLYEYMTKLRAELNTRLDALEAKVNAPRPAASGGGGGPRLSAPPPADGKRREGVLSSAQWVTRQKSAGGAFQVLEVTFEVSGKHGQTEEWTRTIPEYKQDLCAYFVSKAPGDSIAFTEKPGRNPKFNDIVAVG